MLSAKQALELARRFLNQGKPEECLRIVSSLAPNNESRAIQAEAAYRAGQIAVSRGQYGHAKDMFAIASSSRNDGLMCVLAQMRNQLLNAILAKETESVLSLA
jgi:hypothetical protein